MSMMRFATPIDRNRYRKEGGRLTFELKTTEAMEGGGAIYRRLLSAPNFHLSIIFGIVFGISIELHFEKSDSQNLSENHSETWNSY